MKKNKKAHALLVTLIITEILVVVTTVTLMIIFNYNIGIKHEISELRKIVNPSIESVINIMKGLF